jgi:hypothetical protein
MNRPLGAMCCVLGTLGRCSIDWSLLFTVEFAETYFAFFLLDLVLSTFSTPPEPPFDFDGAAATASLSAIFLGPSAGLEGFEEDRRLW